MFRAYFHPIRYFLYTKFQALVLLSFSSIKFALSRALILVTLTVIHYIASPLTPSSDSLLIISSLTEVIHNLHSAEFNWIDPRIQGKTILPCLLKKEVERPNPKDKMNDAVAPPSLPQRRLSDARSDDPAPVPLFESSINWCKVLAASYLLSALHARYSQWTHALPFPCTFIFYLYQTHPRVI